MADIQLRDLLSEDEARQQADEDANTVVETSGLETKLERTLDNVQAVDANVQGNFRDAIDAQEKIDSDNLLDANLIAGGVVDNAEFDRLDGVTDNIQDQLDALDTLAGNTNADVSTVSAHANAAFDHANSAYDHANGAFDEANVRATTDSVNAVHDRANNAFTQANTAYDRGNAAFTQANTAYGQANTAYGQANSAFLHANNAFDHANSAFDTANTGVSNADSAQTTADNAYTQANTAYGAANAAHDEANARATTDSVTAAHDQANSAYNEANSAHTTANGRATTASVTAAHNRANSAFDQANTATMDAATAQTAIDALTDSAIGDKAFKNPATDLTDDEKEAARDAIGAGTGEEEHDHFSATNRLDADFIAGGGVTNAEFDRLAGTTSNIQTQIGQASMLASGASGAASAAHLQANTAYSRANAAYDQANSAYDEANGRATTASVTAAHNQANSAYNEANNRATTASVTAVNNRATAANTLAASANTLATSANTLASTANTRATNAYTQANAAYDQANTATTNADSAYDQANAAYDAANAAASSGGSTYDSTTRLDADFIAGGNVTNAEFDQLRNVEDNIQRQISKRDTDLLEPDNLTFTEFTNNFTVITSGSITDNHIQFHSNQVLIRFTGSTVTDAGNVIQPNNVVRIYHGRTEVVFTVTSTSVSNNLITVRLSSYTTGSNTTFAHNTGGVRVQIYDTARIDASNIAGGSVTNAQFNSLTSLATEQTTQNTAIEAANTLATTANTTATTALANADAAQAAADAAGGIDPQSLADIAVLNNLRENADISANDGPRFTVRDATTFFTATDNAIWFSTATALTLKADTTAKNYVRLQGIQAGDVLVFDNTSTKSYFRVDAVNFADSRREASVSGGYIADTMNTFAVGTINLIVNILRQNAEAIGDIALSNPPADLTDEEKEAVRDAIGAGTGSGGDGSGTTYDEDTRLDADFIGGGNVTNAQFDSLASLATDQDSQNTAIETAHTQANSAYDEANARATVASVTTAQARADAAHTLATTANTAAGESNTLVNSLYPLTYVELADALIVGDITAYGTATQDSIYFNPNGNSINLKLDTAELAAVTAIPNNSRVRIQKTDGSAEVVFDITSKTSLNNIILLNGSYEEGAASTIDEDDVVKIDHITRSGAEIGELALKNAPTDLTDDEKEAVRDAIGAGTGSGGEGGGTSYDEDTRLDADFIAGGSVTNAQFDSLTSLAADQTAQNTAIAAAHLQANNAFDHANSAYDETNLRATTDSVNAAQTRADNANVAVKSLDVLQPLIYTEIIPDLTVMNVSGTSGEDILTFAGNGTVELRLNTAEFNVIAALPNNTTLRFLKTDGSAEVVFTMTGQRRAGMLIILDGSYDQGSRTTIGAGSIVTVQQPKDFDAEIGSSAFNNSPSNLTDAKKLEVRNNIGIVAEPEKCIESITFVSETDTTDGIVTTNHVFEPASFSVLRPSSGTNTIVTNTHATHAHSFQVLEGFYIIHLEGKFRATDNNNPRLAISFVEGGSTNTIVNFGTQNLRPQGRYHKINTSMFHHFSSDEMIRLYLDIAASVGDWNFQFVKLEFIQL